MNPPSDARGSKPGRAGGARPRPDRPRLDRAAVVDAAVALTDAEGIDALTIRRLAQKLSVTPMALYWHFSDKEALLAAAADRLWEEALAWLDAPSLSGGELGAGDSSAGEDDWAPLRDTLHALVHVMRSHPALAGLMPTRVTACEAGLVITERTLSFLADRGLEQSSAFLVAHFALDSAVMLVQNEPGAETFDQQKRAEAIQAKCDALAALPSDRYPHVVAASEFLSGLGNSEEYFNRSIALIVAGARLTD